MKSLSYYIENIPIISDLLNHKCEGIGKDKIYLPNPNFIEDTLIDSSRNIQTIKNMQQLLSHGRLKNTGYLSILPVDQGIEHSVGSAFSKNIDFFNPESIFKLAIEAECNAIASTFGILRSFARKYAHKIPLILKLNHNQLLSYPNSFDQILFTQVEEAWDMGCIGVGATIYFGSQESNDQISQISELFHEAHELGFITILWAYLRNSHFKQGKIDYHLSADLTGQANHLAATLGADIIKQKLPENNGGFNALSFGKTDPLVYSKLTSNHPIDLTRYQVASGYMGRIPLINSGGLSKNQEDDIIEAIQSAIINKRAGGMGIICGRKAFQKPLKDGIELLNRIQDVYLDSNITIA